MPPLHVVQFWRPDSGQESCATLVSPARRKWQAQLAKNRVAACCESLIQLLKGCWPNTAAGKSTADQNMLLTRSKGQRLATESAAQQRIAQALNASSSKNSLASPQNRQGCLAACVSRPSSGLLLSTCRVDPSSKTPVRDVSSSVRDVANSLLNSLVARPKDSSGARS